MIVSDASNRVFNDQMMLRVHGALKRPVPLTSDLDGSHVRQQDLGSPGNLPRAVHARGWGRASELRLIAR